MLPLFLIFASILVGAILAGAVVVAILLLGVFGLVSAGVLSASLLVGIYKKSLAAGFKTFLLLAFSLGGIMVGGGVLLLIKRYGYLDTTYLKAFLLGAAGGFLGGCICSFIAYRLIRLFVEYFRRKLSLAI